MRNPVIWIAILIILGAALLTMIASSRPDAATKSRRCLSVASVSSPLFASTKLRKDASTSPARAATSSDPIADPQGSDPQQLQLD